MFPVVDFAVLGSSLRFRLWVQYIILICVWAFAISIPSSLALALADGGIPSSTGKPWEVYFPLALHWPTVIFDIHS